MRHRVSKLRFGYGVDSNSMLLRKLVTNFVIQGKIVTTHQKALYMRASVDRLVTHATRKSGREDGHVRRVATQKYSSAIQT